MARKPNSEFMPEFLRLIEERVEEMHKQGRKEISFPLNVGKSMTTVWIARDGDGLAFQKFKIGGEELSVKFDYPEQVSR